MNVYTTDKIRNVVLLGHSGAGKTALFTGMRSGELCGLTWDCVDFDRGLIYVKKQLCPPRGIEHNFRFDTLKNGKPRTLAPAPFIMETLREHKKRQEQQKKEKAFHLITKGKTKLSENSFRASDNTAQLRIAG